MTSSIIVVPSIGAIRPFADFVAASVSFSAVIRFSGIVPEKQGGNYGVVTSLEISANSTIELRDVDKDGLAIIQAFPLESKTMKLTLNSVTTMSPLNAMNTISAPSAFLDDGITENSESTALPSEPTLSFGASPLFNEYIMSPISEQVKTNLIATIGNINRFFEMEDKANRLRVSPTQIGEEGTAVNQQASELAELEAVLEKSRTVHESRRQNILKFIGLSYLVLTEKGFEVTRPEYQRVNKDKRVNVPAIDPGIFLPLDFKSKMDNFINDVVERDAFKVQGQISAFIDESVANLVKTVKVQ